MAETSVSLLERLRNPNATHDWSRLVDLYSPLVHTWAKRAGLQDADASDLVQEVFAHLLIKLPEFHYDPSRSFRAWLRTVTLNLWRGKQRKMSVSEENARLDQAPEPMISDPAEAYWKSEFQQQLARRALEIMRDEFQHSTWKACWEVVVEERPPAEVAKELNMSVGAVYAAKFRVLTRLREELAGLDEV